MKRTTIATTKIIGALSVLFGATISSPAQQMVTKHLYHFATPGGGGHPNDSINDHEAFVDAAAFFNDRHGYGELILEDGEYIIGKQQLHWYNDPVPGLDWNDWRYPLGDTAAPWCPSLTAIQAGFVLDSCFNFTLHGGTNTTVRYRDCLYYGTFTRPVGTDSVYSTVGDPYCTSCQDAAQYLLPYTLLHAAVGTMFTFTHCDSIVMRGVELNGNLDAAILGGLSSSDGTQTGYDGVNIYESSRCVIDSVHAHHFGRDGLLLWGGYTDVVLPENWTVS